MPPEKATQCPWDGASRQWLFAVFIHEPLRPFA